jgi:hypothetical protein
MAIIHRIHALPPICEWSNTHNDYVCTEIQFGIYSLDLNRSALPNSNDKCLVVSTWSSVKLNQADSNNFISYSDVVKNGNRSQYINSWIDAKCNVIAIQIENEAKLNGIV